MPVIHRLFRLMLKLLCQPAKKRNATHLVVSFDGGLINIDTSSATEYDILFRGCHEPEIVNLIRYSVRPGNTCLDIGANVGAHTLLMSQLAGPAGRVFAIEPHPQICDRLIKNLDLNRVTNVTVVPAALSKQDGTTDLYGFAENAFHRGTSSLLPDDRAKVQMKVRSIRGSTLQREYKISSCDFVKIDVEGAESLVLSELTELISLHRPAIIFEYRKQHWGKFGHSAPPAIDQLRLLNYHLYYIRRNVTRPLFADIPPETCELFCVPQLRRDPA
jgi:FkbM family methyltransferase